MDIYLSCLIGGAVALVVLAFCGLGFHHVGIRPGAGHSSPAPGGHVRTPGHQTVQHSSGRNTPPNQAVNNLVSGLLTWLSPAYLAGAIIGFGATGTLLKPILHGWLQLGTALLGAYIICFFCIRPLLTSVQKWASLPAKTLTDALLEDGTAVTDFDAKGYGLVRLSLDGQVVQLLGQLAPEEQSGARVRSGETLFVRSVDPGKQRCVVCRTNTSILTKH
ncbi:MAG: hypothetical protein JO025_06965 [Verrucomicrobia bacterium]|nr:hypothetical protein [Verrucomicrobiota bacterium]